MSSDPDLFARLDANAGGHYLEGRIRRAGSRYAAFVNEEEVGRAASLGGAAHQLAAALRRELRGRSQADWGVVVGCEANSSVGLLFGNRRAGGGPGGGSPNECVAEVAEHYRRSPDTLEHALQAAAKLLAECCG